MFIKLPKDVETILTTLHNNGYEAYFVGCFVRDYLLGEECNDIDIATNALPGPVSTIFNVNKTINIIKWFVVIAVNNCSTSNC